MEVVRGSFPLIVGIRPHPLSRRVREKICGALPGRVREKYIEGFPSYYLDS